MPTLASERLRELDLPGDASVSDVGEAVQLKLRRGTLKVEVTVPWAVLEWFVDVADVDSGVRLHDWCDYEGYDKTPKDQLDRQMADDVSRFIERLLLRELRLRNDGPWHSKVMLEWKSNDAWELAVPLTAVQQRVGAKRGQRLRRGSRHVRVLDKSASLCGRDAALRSTRTLDATGTRSRADGSRRSTAA